MPKFKQWGGEVMPKQTKLTEKQKRFCEEYLIDLNATQAAMRAGYKNAEIGRQLITKNNVLEYLKELREKQTERTGINADTVLNELKKIALVDAEISGKEKIKALELLGKHLGMFNERKEESCDNSEIIFNIVPASQKESSQED